MCTHQYTSKGVYVDKVNKSNHKYYTESKRYEHLGAYMRDKRKLYGVTQQELSEALGISKRQIQRFENGAPMNSTYLLKLMFLLHTPTFYSVFGQVEEFREMNQRLGDEPTPIEKVILEKAWNIKK